MGALFSTPKSKGPDPATVAAQRRAEQKSREAESRQQQEEGSRRRLINARAGRGGPITLFSATGEQGVSLKSGTASSGGAS